MWDIDTLDWKTHNLNSEMQIVKDALNKAPASNSGHIALEHEVLSFSSGQNRRYTKISRVNLRLTIKLSNSSYLKLSSLSKAKVTRWLL